VSAADNMEDATFIEFAIHEMGEFVKLGLILAPTFLLSLVVLAYTGFLSWFFIGVMAVSIPVGFVLLLVFRKMRKDIAENYRRIR
jgi:hypothetical protein